MLEPNKSVGDFLKVFVENLILKNNWNLKGPSNSKATSENVYVENKNRIEKPNSLLYIVPSYLCGPVTIDATDFAMMLIFILVQGKIVK